METPLDDYEMFWTNGSFFFGNSFFALPFWFNKGSGGWSGLFKGATSVVVCTAILLAVRRYFKRARGHLLQGQQGSALPSTKTTAQHNNCDRRRKLVVTPSASRSYRLSRHRSLSSEVATLNFVDSDSETDTEVLQKPLDVEVIPVIDEVEVEADDESSELEEEALQKVLEEDTLVEGTGESPVAVSVLPARAQSEANISEYSLTFESASSNSESSLVESQRSPGIHATVVMDLKCNGHIPNGFMDDGVGAEKKRADVVVNRGWVDEGGARDRGRRVGINDVRTSLVDSNDSDVVITQAVVSIA